MRGRTVAIFCMLLGCRRQAVGEGRDQQQTVEVVLAIGDTRGDVAVSTEPAPRRMIEQGGIHLAIAGIPSDGDVSDVLRREIWDAEKEGSNGTVLVTKRCLRDVAPALEKDLLGFWTVAVVVGARCDGTPRDRIGAMLLVDSPSRIKITFDRATHAFVKVEPVP